MKEKKITNNPEDDRVFPLDNISIFNYANDNKAKLENVNIHTGGFSNDLALLFNAFALVFGNDIFFRNGAYKPETEEGRKTKNSDVELLEKEAEYVESQVEYDADGKKPYVIGNKVYYLEEAQIEQVEAMIDRKMDNWVKEQEIIRGEEEYLKILYKYKEWKEEKKRENRRTKIETYERNEHKEVTADGAVFDKKSNAGRNNPLHIGQDTSGSQFTDTMRDDEEQQSSNINNNRRNQSSHQDLRRMAQDGRLFHHPYVTRVRGNTALLLDQNNNQQQNEAAPPVPVPEGRISMQDAFGSDFGPCLFRALLAIAETRAGRPLNQEQLNAAKEMYYGDDLNNWRVANRRADALIGEASNAFEDVINIGLELLEHNERAGFIVRTEFPNINIPPGTQATIIGVPGIDPYHHFLEGDAMGNMIYDPLHDLDTYINRRVIRIDAIRFIPIQRQGEP